MHKHYANRGVERNKKPLKNKLYRVEISSRLENVYSGEELKKYEKYKFKDLGYLVLLWGYDDFVGCNNFHGFITPSDLKEILGEKQWGKFCQGKREFTIQRRVNGRNIKKKEKA